METGTALCSTSVLVRQGTVPVLSFVSRIAAGI